MKLTKIQKERLFQANKEYLLTLDNTKLFVALDLSLSCPGYSMWRGGEEIISGSLYENEKKSDKGEQISNIYTYISTMIAGQDCSDAIFIYERVSASTSFTGLRAVVMAETSFLQVIYEAIKDNKKSIVTISPTSLKKYFTGVGRLSAEQKKVKIKEYKLKSAQDPHKQMLMNNLETDYNRSFKDYSENNTAEAIACYLFVYDLLSLMNQVKEMDYNESMNYMKNAISKSKFDVIVSFLESFELLKENLSNYEYQKIRKKILKG